MNHNYPTTWRTVTNTMLRKRSQPQKFPHNAINPFIEASGTSWLITVRSGWRWPFSGDKDSEGTCGDFWRVVKFSFLVWLLGICESSLSESLSSCVLRICVFFCMLYTNKYTIHNNTTKKIKQLKSPKPAINWAIFRLFFFSQLKIRNFLIFKTNAISKLHSI